MSWRWLLLLVIGLAQMVADVAGLELLRGAAAALGASPAPKVFTRVGRLEPFSARFALVVTEVDGRTRRVELSRERYAQIAGPHNRRNTFGAVIAAGPELARDPIARPLFEQVGRYALCGSAPLLRELGVAVDEVASVTIEHEPRMAATGASVAVVVCR